MKLARSIFLVLVCAAPVAWADVVVIGHPSGPDAMEANHVRDLFINRAKTLPNGQQAVPLDLANDSPLREEFHNKVTGRSQAQLNAFWSQQVFTGKGNPPRALDSTAAMKTTVANTPGAVGYIPADEVDGSVKVILKP